MNIQRTHRPAVVQRSAPQAQPPGDSTGKCECECKEKPGLFARTADIVLTGTRNTLNEGVLAAKNDPALAMRISATALSDTILKKVDPSIKGGFDKTIVPVMRFALLGGNVVRAKNTFSNPTTSTMERAIDATVVATDLAGAIGGIGVLTGKFVGLGETLMGFSYAVDAISHAYRGLNHAGDRIKFWSEKAEADKQKKAEEANNPRVCALHPELKA
ncbi:MAG: hypothetical protein WC314_27250 [Vulcanimicrobiota bacterium]